MTKARFNYFKRLNRAIADLRSGDTIIIADNNEEGVLEQTGKITTTDYVNVGQVANVKLLPLGTDNFGRDVLKQLVSATGTSIKIGLIAGTVATLIGLTLGLLSGYLGGFMDDFIMFITNVFTVIPGFVLLILISYSIGQEQRGATVVAAVIGLTSWTWTCRSVRSQVISLRNRDHVNLSKLSGHSLIRIVLTDILPYIASYVVMAFILQVSSGILSEAQLSLLGLGPRTTETATLGLMMNWAMLYSAHTNGSWWAYFPVILTITLISFSLNLMNTGLDQVFNPTLRD
jgi:peptide/nickel transport system permease protein